MSDTVERFVNCLQAVADEPGGISAIRLAERLGLSRVSASRLLRSMDQAGIVEKNRETRKYGIGLNLWLLGQAALGWRHVMDLSLLPMARVVSITGSTLTIGANSGRRTIFLNKVERLEGIVLVTPGPATYPAHVTAVGKAILAYAGDDFINDYIAGGLEAITDVTITSGPALLDELRLTRERGYSVTVGEHRTDRRGMAVPLMDRRGTVVAALGAACDVDTFTEEFVRQHLPLLRDAGTSISRLLGNEDASASHVA